MPYMHTFRLAAASSRDHKPTTSKTATSRNEGGRSSPRPTEQTPSFEAAVRMHAGKHPAPAVRLHPKVSSSSRPPYIRCHGRYRQRPQESSCRHSCGLGSAKPRSQARPGKSPAAGIPPLASRPGSLESNHTRKEKAYSPPGAWSDYRISRRPPCARTAIHQAGADIALVPPGENTLRADRTIAPTLYPYLPLRILR